MPRSASKKTIEQQDDKEEYVTLLSSLVQRRSSRRGGSAASLDNVLAKSNKLTVVDSASTWKSLIGDKSGPMLLVGYSDGCGHCHHYVPLLVEALEQLDLGKTRVCVANARHLPLYEQTVLDESGDALDIKGVPTVLLVEHRNGRWRVVKNVSPNPNTVLTDLKSAIQDRSGGTGKATMKWTYFFDPQRVFDEVHMRNVELLRVAAEYDIPIEIIHRPASKQNPIPLRGVGPVLIIDNPDGGSEPRVLRGFQTLAYLAPYVQSLFTAFRFVSG